MELITRARLGDTQTEKKEKQHSLHKETKQSIDKKTTQKFAKKPLPKPNPWRDGNTVKVEPLD